MKQLKTALKLCIIILSAAIPSCISAQTDMTKTDVIIPHNSRQDSGHVMSKAYWKIWNAKVQKKIDDEIAKNRMVNASVVIEAAPGTVVSVKQLTSDFWYGAHIFNFNQLGTHERNERYKQLYGTLFNSATVSFYWRKWETEPGRQRFREEKWDTEEWWNNQERPAYQNHWRRPASDPVVDFCLKKGIRIQGHPLVWGNRRWNHPEWILTDLMNPDERARLDSMIVKNDGFINKSSNFTTFNEKYKLMTSAELEKLLPRFAKNYQKIFDSHIKDLADYYGDRINSWDVVNESATDYLQGNIRRNEVFCKSEYGLMPGDYPYAAFRTADKAFPKDVVLNINDYQNGEAYVNQVKELLSRGCRIDLLGSQMHLFKPQQCADIAAGKDLMTPNSEWNKFSVLSKAGLPIHMSEITITAPEDNCKGRMVQAVIARNLYRLWFSVEAVAGITWWNVVDNCGAPGEPSTSGLFTRDMQPKPSYYALDELINHEWKTRLEVKVSKDRTVSFRGFRGEYEISWTDKEGQHTMKYHLK